MPLASQSIPCSCVKHGEIFFFARTAMPRQMMQNHQIASAHHALWRSLRSTSSVSWCMWGGADVPISHMDDMSQWRLKLQGNFLKLHLQHKGCVVDHPRTDLAVTRGGTMREAWTRSHSARKIRAAWALPTKDA